jgi:hypothetical protein
MPEQAPQEPKRPDRARARSAERDPEKVSRVYGEPIVVDDTKIIPVASVRRCGRRSGDEEGGRRGGGCVIVRPVGLVVIQNGRVRWKPAVDVNRLALAGAALCGLALVLRRRRRR